MVKLQQVEDSWGPIYKESYEFHKFFISFGEKVVCVTRQSSI